jgi:preprotein translocase subunit SecE
MKKNTKIVIAVCLGISGICAIIAIIVKFI